MVSSGRGIIVSLLLILTAIASAHAQTAADKALGSTISGKVTLGSKGVSGIVVGLAISTPSSSTYITKLKGVTDEEGNYRIKNVPPNTYQVLVSSPQYVLNDGRVSIVVGKNEVVENVNLTLIRGGVITGKVIDADGRPVVEERISCSLTTSSNALPYFRTILTDDRGIYRAYGLAPGRYTVSAGNDSMSSFRKAETAFQRTYHPSTTNAAEATEIEVNEGSEATNVDITLGRQLTKYVARGRIIDGETSQPLPNAPIGVKMFFGAGGSMSTGVAAKSTKDGDFKIENLPPGKYGAYLDSEADSGQFSEIARFEVTDQDVEGLLIKTSKGASVSGVVVFDGPPDATGSTNLAGYQFVAYVSDVHRGNVVFNPDGTFRLTGLPPGRLVLQLQQTRNNLRIVRIERDGVAYPRGIDIRDRDQIKNVRVIVSQANGKIRGVLKLPDGFTLPAAAQLFVWVRRIEDPAVNISPVAANARGEFLLEGLVAGTYEFNVRLVGVPADQQPNIPRPTQTVVVTHGAVADVTIPLLLPKTGP